MNKKSIIIIVVILAIIVAIIGGVVFIKTYGEGTAIEKSRIRISRKTWAGEPDFEAPEPEITETDIALNKTITIHGWNDLKIRIVKINKDSIKIKMNQTMEGMSNGEYIESKTFVIENGKTLELRTPTLDAGEIYNIDINI